MRDRAVVVAVQLEHAERCDTCGTSPWQWKDDPNAFVAVEEVCQGCFHRERHRDARDAARKAGETALPGMKVRLVRAAKAALIQASQKAERPKSRREKAREAR